MRDAHGPMSHPRATLVEMDATRSPAEEQLALAKTWLYSPEGAQTARRLLGSYRSGIAKAGGAPVDLVGDLQAEALRKIWRRIERYGPIDEFNPGAYLTTVMRSIMTDVARGRRSSDSGKPVPEGHPDPKYRPAFDDPAAHDLGAAVCAAIEASDAVAWVKAAAVIYVTLLAYPEAVEPSYPAPRPVKGATEREATMWLALWFAGRRDKVFPRDGEAAEAKVRKARSRAAAAVEELVEAAASAVRLERSGV